MYLLVIQYYVTHCIILSIYVRILKEYFWSILKINIIVDMSIEIIYI